MRTKTQYELAQLLISRGMKSKVGLSGAALESMICNKLKYVNYYRLADYWYIYRIPLTAEKRGKNFMQGTCWEDVCALYEFDRMLRLMLFEPVSVIEITLREVITEVLACNNRLCINPQSVTRHYERRFRKSCRIVSKNTVNSCDYLVANENTELYLPAPIQEKYGASLLDSNSRLGELMRKVQELYHAGQSESDIYYKNKLKIKDVQVLPIWVFMEHMTFGSLNTLLSVGLKKIYVDQIALSFGFTNTQLFTSIIALLHRVRNQCAHQGRVWNYQWGRINKNNDFIPILKTELYNDFAKTYGDSLPISPSSTAAVIAISRFIMDRLCPGNDWYERVLALVESCPVPDIALMMGMNHIPSLNSPPRHSDF